MGNVGFGIDFFRKSGSSTHLNEIFFSLGRFPSGRAFPLRHTCGNRVYPNRFLRHHDAEFQNGITQWLYLLSSFEIQKVLHISFF